MNLLRRNFTKKASASLFYSLFFMNHNKSFASSTEKTIENNIIDKVNELKKENNTSLKLLFPQGSFANIKPVIDQFSSQTNINIDVIETAVDDINTKVMIDHTLGEFKYDIALPATFGIPDLVEAGAISNLSSLSKKYSVFHQHNKSLYDLGNHYKDNLYGYQTDGDVYLMFYNKAWMTDPEEQIRFKEKHNKDLDIPKTWEELDQLMSFFHRPDENKYGGCLFRTPAYMVWEWWIRFHAKGKLPFDSKMNPQINSVEGISALEELILASNYQHPSSKSNNLFDNWKVFSEGNCFVNIGWGGTQKYLNRNSEKLKNNMLFSATPGISYFNWGWNYVVTSLSKQQELAYLFCLYAVTSKISTLSVREAQGYFDPFKSEHYSDNIIQKSYGQDFLKAHKEAISEAIPDLYIKGQGKYFDVLRENIVLASSGEISPKMALDYTSKIWEKINHEMGVNSQIEQWAYLKKQYPMKYKFKP